MGTKKSDPISKEKNLKGMMNMSSQGARGAIMKFSKLVDRSIFGPMMVLFTFFFAMDVSSAA
ncbi:MAG TPA: hypothetical protein VJ248_11385, partial [Candidatus Udaeobacter sp.]|nr:hypothetical protein [Candidatus Udaeobacter sp.]